MNRLLFLLFCFCSVGAAGQDLTGIWRGHFKQAGNRMIEQLLGEEDRYKFEIQLDQNGKQFNGVTYSYKTTVFYGKATCSGTIHLGTKKVRLEELKIVELRMVAGCTSAFSTASFFLSLNTIEARYSRLSLPSI